MPWLNYDPWNESWKRAACVALGRNYIGGRILGPTSPGRIIGGPGGGPGGSGGSGFGNGEISVYICTVDGSPTVIEITLVFIPSEPDLGKSLRLFQDRVMVNNIPLDRISNQGSTYPFYIGSSDKNVFTFRINAASIPNWYSLTAVPIKIDICYDGDQYNRQAIVYTIETVFNKGPQSPPVSLSIIDNNFIRISFKGIPGTSCTCLSDCIPSSGLNIICPDNEFDIIQQISVNDERCTLFSFTLEDSNGNTNTITIPIVQFVRPLHPSVVVRGPKPTRHIVVGVPPISYIFVDLQDCVTHYQVERYVGSEGNKALIADHIPLFPYNIRSGMMLANSSNVITDNDVHTNIVHAYRTRFLGKYKDWTQWSNWTTVTPTVLTEDYVSDDEI